MIKRRILVVADDKFVCHLMKERMENDNMAVCCTNSPSEALDSFMKQAHCLVIMDFQLLGANGLDMLHIMRNVKHTPILVITPRLNSEEKVALFQAGANAYIEMPVDITVCVAQAVRLIELYESSDDRTKGCYPLTFGTELIINPLYRQVIVDGTVLDLTRTEFDLLFCMAQHPGQVWSRNQLYRSVWADSLGAEGENTVRTHIGNLRKKFADAGKDYVQTARGIGYKFVPPMAK